MSKIVEPSFYEAAFNCPHCFAFTTQFWHSLYARRLDEKKRTPVTKEDWRDASFNMSREQQAKSGSLFEKISTGLICLGKNQESEFVWTIHNLFLSECYNCKKFSVWANEQLVFPNFKTGILPNTDLPDDIKRDFEEACKILGGSPRGAAALSRLCIQKLCIHLGEKGKKIDDDIASLVRKGLNPLVQQSLDIVRVIGNEAVHPGIMDLRDDTATAATVLNLVNTIAEQMISHPKAVNEMFSKLPEGKRKAIADRDKK